MRLDMAVEKKYRSLTPVPSTSTADLAQKYRDRNENGYSNGLSYDKITREKSPYSNLDIAKSTTSVQNWQFSNGLSSQIHLPIRSLSKKLPVTEICPYSSIPSTSSHSTNGACLDRLRVENTQYPPFSTPKSSPKSNTSDVNEIMTRQLNRMSVVVPMRRPHFPKSSFLRTAQRLRLNRARNYLCQNGTCSETENANEQDDTDSNGSASTTNQVNGHSAQKWRGVDDTNEAGPLQQTNSNHGPIRESTPIAARNEVKAVTQNGVATTSANGGFSNGTSSPSSRTPKQQPYGRIHQELNITPANKVSEFDEPAVGLNGTGPRGQPTAIQSLETKSPRSPLLNGSIPGSQPQHSPYAQPSVSQYNKQANAVGRQPQRQPSIAGKLANMPKFHFPGGKPVPRAENDAVSDKVKAAFDMRPGSQLSVDDFEEVCRRMNFPIYSKRAVFDACSGPINQTLNFAHFCAYWNKMTSRCHDETSRFVFTLASARAGHRATGDHISKEDFMPMLMDLIHTHPGLHFLKDAPQFHSKYCEVVIVRIFWNVNRSWTGLITPEELRRSNFLETLHSLEEVTDINKITDYFSYEHFYVTYCKFWEIDTDHDMVISRDDMRQHCNGALTDRIIDRIFSAAVIRTPPEQRTHRVPGPVRTQPIETIGFEDFVAFLLAEEDKRHPTSIEYWFRCVDLDGDGIISLYEMEYFYAEIEQKLLQKNMETLSLRDVICNLLDSVSPSNLNYVTRSDLRKSGLAHRFFNTFVNYLKYLEQESSEGERASVKTAGDKEMTDWETFCAVEYELLMSETDGVGDGYTDDNIDVILDDEEQETEELDVFDGLHHASQSPAAQIIGRS
ncbi:EF-hand domain pair domain-containing protein [Ditylenchus destructor]|uniref:EF-hand domain pair domain-containing protein n=1 Tax=Ditylenchus destructor TaxID=166010 RepID=A0AAD4R155_9BILA|nr:EF-hand domain pair domain-containing protein [Ditylenchus destructor]